MKAFRKWWAEGSWSLQCSHDDAEQAYREALEEVLKRFKISHSESDIIDWIEKELEDESI